MDEEVRDFFHGSMLSNANAVADMLCEAGTEGSNVHEYTESFVYYNMNHAV